MVPAFTVIVAGENAKLDTVTEADDPATGAVAAVGVGTGAGFGFVP